MEDCTLRTIENFEELETVLKKASETNHPNAKNFLVDKMHKRWNNYLQFSLTKFKYRFSLRFAFFQNRISPIKFFCRYIKLPK